VRKAFIAASGYVLLVADYSQIELRILAHLADDEDLREAFRNGLDIHTETAAKIFGIQSKDVDVDLRNRAKAINFGVLYGMGSRRLAKETGISTQEADAFISRYFQRFPRIKAFIDATLRTARQEGGVRTILGRWRPLPDLNSSDPGKRQSAERMAVNTPIQGSAADLIKLAMIRIYDRLNDSGVDAHMLLQVHDELVFEVREDSVEEIAGIVTDSMKSAISLTVPLGVDVGTGKNWLDAK
jgi:DNA polymerase-1